MPRLLVAFALVASVACRREPVAPSQPRPAPHPPSAERVPKPEEAKPAKPPATPPVVRDLDAIRQASELRVLFTFNSTGYFIYRGETMGYEYELLDLFAREMSCACMPVVVRDSTELFDKLNRGDGDVVAAQLAVPRRPIGRRGDASALRDRAGGRAAQQRAVRRPAATPTVAAALAREEQETARAGRRSARG